MKKTLALSLLAILLYNWMEPNPCPYYAKERADITGAVTGYETFPSTQQQITNFLNSPKTRRDPTPQSLHQQLKKAKSWPPSCLQKTYTEVITSLLKEP